MKKYILVIRNIYTKDEAYGPYDTRDSARLHMYKIYGDDWTYPNFELLELKNPNELKLERKQLKGSVSVVSNTINQPG